MFKSAYFYGRYLSAFSAHYKDHSTSCQQIVCKAIAKHLPLEHLSGKNGLSSESIILRDNLAWFWGHLSAFLSRCIFYTRISFFPSNPHTSLNCRWEPSCRQANNLVRLLVWCARYAHTCAGNGLITLRIIYGWHKKKSTHRDSLSLFL